MLNGAFWQGRRVLVTGHAGFKGGWLCAWLARLGAHVEGIGLPSEEQPSLLATAGLSREVPTRVIDVRHGEALLQAMQAGSPEIVFHLAAQSLVLTGVQEPVETFATNVMGTVNLLEAARHTPSVRAVVVVTSDKCYGDSGLIHDEDAPLNGVEPYGASKACAELVTAAYRTTYLAEAGIGVATTRAGNVIGGGDMAPNRLIPDLVRAYEAGHAAILRHPDAVRPWQYVLDALAGYLMLAERLTLSPHEYAGPWNFGSGAGLAVTVSELATGFAEAFGGGAIVCASEPDRHEAPVLRLSSVRARHRLGWRPRVPIVQAIRWTAEGYRRMLADDSGWLTEQIDRYVELVAHAGQAELFEVPEARRALA